MVLDQAVTAGGDHHVEPRSNANTGGWEWQMHEGDATERLYEQRWWQRATTGLQYTTSAVNTRDMWSIWRQEINSLKKIHITFKIHSPLVS